jgi:hypothetical protein
MLRLWNNELSRWLGAKSHIKERTAKEEGVPV